MNWIAWFSVFIVIFAPSLTQRRAIVSYPVTVAPPGPTKSSIQPTATRPPSRPPTKGDPSPDPRIAPDALKPVYDSGYRSGSTTNSSSSRPSNDDRGEKGHRPYPENPRVDPKNRPDESSRGSESILNGRESSLPKGDFGSTGRAPSKPPARPLPLTPLNREASQGSKGSDTGIDRDGVRKSEDGDRSSARDAPSRDDRPRLPLERETRPKTEETDYRLRGADRGKSDVDTPARDADDYGSSYPRTDRRPPVRDDYDKGRSRDRDFRDDEDSYDKGRSTVPRDGERSSSDRDYADRDAYDDRRKSDRDDYGRDDDRRSYPPPRDYDKGRAPSIDDRRSDRDRDYRDRDRDLPPRRDRPRYDGDYEKGRPPVSRDRDTYDEGRRLSDRGYSDRDRRYDDEKSRRDPDYGGLRDVEPRSRDYDRRDEDRGRDYYDDEGYRDRRRPQGSRRVSSDDDDEYYRRRERPPDSRKKGDDSAYYDDRRSYGEDRSRDRTDDDRYRGRDYSSDSEDRYRSTSRSRRPEDDDRYRSREDDDRYRSREDDRYAERRDLDSRDDGYRDRDRRVDERRTRVDDRSSDRTLPDSHREEYSVRSRPDRPIDDRDRPLPTLSEDRYRSDSVDDDNARKRIDPRDDPPRDLPRSEISLRTISERPKSNTPDDRYRDTSRDRERPSSYDRDDDDYRRDSDPPRSRDDKERRDEPSGEDRYRDRSDRPYDDRYKVTSSRRSEESVGSRTWEDSRYVDDRRDSPRSREPYDDKYYRDIESSRGKTDDFSDKGAIRSEDDYRRDNERTRSASSSERDVILSTRYPVTDKGDSKGSKPDDGYLRSRSYSSSEGGYDERDRRYSETSRSEPPRISSSRSRPRSETYPSSYEDEERYRERPSSRYDRDDHRKGDSEVRSDEERYRYRRKSVTEDEYRNAQEERYRRERTRSDQTSGRDRDSGVGRYDGKGVRYYEERLADNAKGNQKERRMYFADEERKDASDDKGSLRISRDESDRDGDSTSIRNSDSDYKSGSRSQEPTHHFREEPKAAEDSMYLQSSRHENGAESRYPTISGRETVKHTNCNEETESLVRDSNPSFPKSSSLPESSVTSSQGSSGYDCGGDHVHIDSTREHASRSRDTADQAETFTGSRSIYPTRSFADSPSSKFVRSTTVYDQSSSSFQNGGNREDQKVHQAKSSSSHDSGDSENKYKKGISIPFDEQPTHETRNTPQTTVIPSDPSERPLTLKEVIEAAYRHPESPAPKGEVYYPVYDPRINNITSPEVIRPSERRGITISTRKRRK